MLAQNPHPHVHVTQVERRIWVPRPCGGLEITSGLVYVLINAPSEQPAVAHVALRLGDTSQRQVLVPRHLA